MSSFTSYFKVLTSATPLPPPPTFQLPSADTHAEPYLDNVGAFLDRIAFSRLKVAEAFLPVCTFLPYNVTGKQSEPERRQNKQRDRPAYRNFCYFCGPHRCTILIFTLAACDKLYQLPSPWLGSSPVRPWLAWTSYLVLYLIITENCAKKL